MQIRLRVGATAIELCRINGNIMVTGPKIIGMAGMLKVTLEKEAAKINVPTHCQIVCPGL